MSNSFSMAKSIITMLVQIAVQDGYIDSWDDPITKYIPEYEIPEGVAEPTLRHFSTMTAGMQIKENYKAPFSKTAKLYYGDNVIETALSIPCGQTPRRRSIRIPKRTNADFNHRIEPCCGRKYFKLRESRTLCKGRF